LQSIAEARAAYASYELKILESPRAQRETDWLVHNKLYQAANDELVEVYNQRLGEQVDYLNAKILKLEQEKSELEAAADTRARSSATEAESAGISRILSHTANKIPRGAGGATASAVWLECGSALEAKSTGSRRISNRRISHVPSSVGTGANCNATAERA
jgi:hypothetical protein